ncbi:MAG: NHLP leader peptide family RiPP precursor [Acidobacteriota bacterium]
MGEILERAAHDQIFRGQLLEDPKEVIYEEFGVAIPDAFRIRFIERDPELNALVVLPDFEGNGNGELCEDDLDNVCGGNGGQGGGW